MKLFSGDKTGHVVTTEVDFYLVMDINLKETPWAFKKTTTNIVTITFRSGVTEPVLQD